MAISVEDLNEVNPDKKGKDYCMRMLKNMHNANNQSNSVYFNQKVKWELNRRYARGQQPIDNAKAALDRAKAVNYDNLNWSVPKALPIIFDIMVGIILRLDIDMQCDSIDPENVDKKILEKYRIEAEIMLRKELENLGMLAGAEMKDPTNTYNDVEELQIDVDAGMFKLDLEIAMEEVIEIVFDINKIQQLRKVLTRDCAHCGMGVLRHYVLNTGKIAIRRVDPVNFISNFVTTPDYRELNQAAEYQFLFMSQLREVSSFTDEEYIKIALNVAGKFGNPPLTNLGNAIALYQNPIGGGYVFDNYTICVLYGEWATTDRYTHIIDKPNHYGNTKTHRVMDPSKLGEESKKYSKSTDYKVWYKGSWLLDSEFCYDYGRLEFPNVKANALNESTSTFAVAAVDINNMVTTTYTERLQEPMDMAYLCWMQYQSHLAKAVPPGIYAEILAITNIPNGKNGFMQPLDVLERYVQTGNLLGNSLLKNGQIMQRKPAEILPGSDFTKAQAFYAQFLQHYETCKLFVGLNEFTDASNPNPEQSVGGAKLAVQGTNNSLRPLIDCIDLILEKVAEGIVNRCQHMAGKGQLDYLANAIGRRSILALSVSDDISAAGFGIKIGQRIDEEDKMRIQNYINQSLAQRSTTGVGGIEIEDALAIERYKNSKAKERLLVKRREMRTRKDMEMSRQKQEDNAMVQDKSIQSQKQAKMEVAAQELDIYTRKKEIDFEFKQRELVLSGKLKENQIVKQGEVKDDNIVTQGMVDKKLLDATPAPTTSK